MNIGFLGSVLGSSKPLFDFRQTVFVLFRWTFLAYIVAAAAALVVSLKRAEGKGERSRIQWLLYGLVVGLSPFALFYQLPLALGGGPILSEELTGAFFLAVPAAFAISIVRHKLMDIELVISKTVVYKPVKSIHVPERSIDQVMRGYFRFYIPASYKKE